MNFKDAITAHALWKMKLTNYIKKPDGSLKPSEIEPDNRCELGKWLHGEGKKHSASAEYKQLVEIHAKFHKAAANIVRRADAGENVSEDVALGAKSEYAHISGEITKLLMNMEKSKAA